MKRVLTSAMLLLALALPFVALASNPTVTITQLHTANTVRYYAWSYSFTTSTALATVDTAFILPSSTSVFSIAGGEGAHFADSTAIITFNTTETSHDSVRFRVFWQVTAIASPELEAGDMKTWATAKQDTTAFLNPLPLSGVSSFAIRRHAGQATKLRLVVLETGGTKSSAQTISGVIMIPRR